MYSPESLYIHDGPKVQAQEPIFAFVQETNENRVHDTPAWYIVAESSGPQMFLPNHFSKAGFAGDAAKTLSHSLPGSESLLSPPGRKKGFNRSGPVEKKSLIGEYGLKLSS